ncbi:MAG: TonB-dependent receptor [Terriglobales bacterium]
MRTACRFKPVGIPSMAWVLASSVLASTAARAQTPSDSLEEVIVTAQQRAENLHDVPISVQAIDNEHLEDLQVTGLDGYAMYLTSLSSQNSGPGEEQLYMRGVTNGSDGDRAGSQPLVGVYLDDFPVTTITYNLDLHIYDVARIEALSGPQGTALGASSMGGTLRIITNKPDTTAFAAGYDVTADTFNPGSTGGKLEGFVNVPLSERAALRLTAYAEHDGGYINNVMGPAETFATSGLPRTNAALESRHFNPLDTGGARAALKLIINDDWTLTPSLMGQVQRAPGTAFFTPALGDLNIARYLPDSNTDHWWLAGVTLKGKILDFDLSYGVGYLGREVHNLLDFSDNSFYNDQASPGFYGGNFRDNDGNLISPATLTAERDGYSKQMQDLHIATPVGWRLQGVVGIFAQRQSDDIRIEQQVAGLADQYSITNLPGVLNLDSLHRTDRDLAAFTDWSFNLTARLTASAGIRRFAYDNTVLGFAGYNGQPTFDGFTYAGGEQDCEPGTQSTGTEWPCIDVNSRATGAGSTHRLTLSYRFDSDRMVYATSSTGFRPGGINLVQSQPSYGPDYLTNFEVGWKTEWLERRLRVDGALFLERWKDAQFSLPGVDTIAQITNVGRAQIKGIESELLWRATAGLTLSASMTALDAKTTRTVCTFVSASNTCTEPVLIHNPDGSVAVALPNSIQAPSDSRLPFSPRFKGNLIARYQFGVGQFDAHVQGAVVAQSDVLPQLAVAFNQLVGDQPGYASANFAAGLRRQHWQTELYVQNAFDRRGQAGRYTECYPGTCPAGPYVVPIAARLIGLTVSERW